jgi:hypothetical protein
VREGEKKNEREAELKPRKWERERKSEKEGEYRKKISKEEGEE